MIKIPSSSMKSKRQNMNSYMNESLTDKFEFKIIIGHLKFNYHNEDIKEEDLQSIF